MAFLIFFVGIETRITIIMMYRFQIIVVIKKGVSITCSLDRIRCSNTRASQLTLQIPSIDGICPQGLEEVCSHAR